MKVDIKALAARLGPTGIGLAVLAVLVVLFYLLWQHSAASGAGDRLKAGQSGATAASAIDASHAAGNVSANAQVSEDLTRSNAKAIDAAPGAHDAVNPGVRNAGFTALCRRASFAAANPTKCKGASK